LNPASKYQYSDRSLKYFYKREMHPRLMAQRYMVHTGFLRQIVQPVSGLALTTLMAIAYSSASVAQSPAVKSTAPAPSNTSNNSLSNLDQEAYILGPGDLIKIDMFDQTELFKAEGYQVLVDGTISLPFIGRVSVSGLSLKQASSAISAKYTRFFKRPLVTVALLTPRSVTIGISGEVRRPGSYPVSAVEDKMQLPTLTQAIKIAGGTTQSANLRQVQVRRPRKSGPDEIITIDLVRLLKEGDLRQDLTLRDRDSVFIPTATSFDLADSSLLADASFAATNTDPLNVGVVGEVYRPGPYTLSPGNNVVGSAGSVGNADSTSNRGGIKNQPTVTQAIQAAGGIKPQADIRTIQIRRITRTGAEQLVTVDFWKMLQEGDLKQDIALQQGDTIIVPTATATSTADATKIATASFSPATIDVNVVGEVPKPGIAKVPPNSPLNTALLAAGGFDNKRARKSSVDLIRLNPDGTVSQRTVAINFDKGINEQTNPALRNNDVIVVRRSGLTTFTDNLGNALAPVTSGLGALSIFRIFGGL
jgi:polysaccharide export outer membrane protein